MGTTFEERFWAKVEKTPTCWLWRAGKDHLGYGQIRRDGSHAKAHRVAYDLLVGPIPDGLELDHLCRVRNCVNPAHLEPVTHAENVRRGLSGQRQRAKTHCPAGHPYDAENTYVAPRGDRGCRACRMASKRRYEARLVAESRG